MSSLKKPSKNDVVTDFRRSQILDAARESFAKIGLAATTVDDIARRAGVAKGTVYLYYRSKEAILQQILDDDVSEMQEGTVSIVKAPGEADEKLTRFLVAALTIFDRKRDFFEHVHLEMGPDVRKKAMQKFDALFNAQVAAWKTVLADAKARGQIGDIDPSQGARLIVALTTGLAKQRCRGWSGGPVGVLASEMSAMVWKGLATR